MARKVTRVYKVVRRVGASHVSRRGRMTRVGGRLLSALASIPPTWQVAYIPGKWIGPQHEGSLLFAFPTAARATRFRSGGEYETWLADAEVVTKRSGFWQVTNGFAFMLSSFSDGGLLRRFWRRKTKPAYTYATPGGTVGCRRIRLISQVTRRY